MQRRRRARHRCGGHGASGNRCRREAATAELYRRFSLRVRRVAYVARAYFVQARLPRQLSHRASPPGAVAKMDPRAALEGLMASGAFTREAAEGFVARMMARQQGHDFGFGVPRQPKPKKQRCVPSRGAPRDCARRGETTGGPLRCRAPAAHGSRSRAARALFRSRGTRRVARRGIGAACGCARAAVQRFSR